MDRGVVEIVDDEEAEPTEREAATPSIGSSSQSQMQVIIKKDVWTKPYLLCELQDEHLNFDGDSGAIGRFTVTADKMEIDLKGRQFAARIAHGPIVLMLNVAPPVGQAKSAVIGRIEAVCNEFCRLEFQRDMMSDLQGIFSGDINGLADEIEDVAKKSSKRPRSDDAADDSAASDSDEATSRLEKRPSVRDNPKISTITNRQRISKKGSAAKKTAAKKKKTVKSVRSK